MTKEEKAREIVRMDGSCYGVPCEDGDVSECPCYNMCGTSTTGRKERVILCTDYLASIENPIREKTLLDEFAMAAMGVILDKGILHGMPDETNPFVVDAALCAKSSYDYAAAMMAERARRDEMGNVKEGK